MVSLYDNKFSVDGTQRLVDELQLLFPEENEFGDVGTKSLTGALPKNGVLYILSFDHAVKQHRGQGGPGPGHPRGENPTR